MTDGRARNDPQVLRAATIGAAWLAVAERIMTEGAASRYDGMPVCEIAHVTLAVEHPEPEDEIIARLAEPERLAWLQRHVAGELGRPVGRLLMVVKSAHVYQTEFEYVRAVLAQSK